MERIQKLTADSDYRRYLCVTAQYEKERQYCRHDFNHLLDVARIAWILCLERKLEVRQEVAYAAALLHDIGRFAQYADKAADHATESAKLAEPLLQKHDFTPAEVKIICEAISAHREEPHNIANPFYAVLAEADDLSRRCFDCTAQEGCYKFERMATRVGIRY